MLSAEALVPAGKQKVCLWCSQLSTFIFHPSTTKMQGCSGENSRCLILDVQFRLLLAVTTHKLCLLRVSSVAESDSGLSPALAEWKAQWEQLHISDRAVPLPELPPGHWGLPEHPNQIPCGGRTSCCRAAHFSVRVSVINPQCKQGLKKKGAKAFENISEWESFTLSLGCSPGFTRCLVRWE